ncbi:MAG: sirohydrochlorin cobaltochelatase [Gemmiger sp.]|nr:sirohydrochlorin cobaltochelatase [Gemmiger sp.]
MKEETTKEETTTKKALLCVSFGTSVPEARGDIAGVEKALAAVAVGYDVFTAFTSPTIRRILAARGENVPHLAQALDHLATAGYREVVVQPTYLLYGVEYERLAAACRAETRFATLRLGTPLLADNGDLRRLATALAGVYPASEGTALVLMGHGTPGFAAVSYPALESVFRWMGRGDVFVGTVEGWPGLAEVRASLRRAAPQRVVLAPLLLVAGDHARNDMAGPGPKSWQQVLEADGLAVTPCLQGLGALPVVQALYGEHLKQLLQG